LEFSDYEGNIYSKKDQIPKDRSYILSKNGVYILRSLNKNFRFRSNEQRIALEKDIFTEDDLIIILPTGQGKSLLFFSY
jgi:superfamily II DNA helicase RecQ